MNLTDELERLAALHSSGALNDTEYAAAKMRLLSAETSAGDTIGRAANRFVTFQMAMAVIGLIIFAVVFFGVILPHIRAVDSQFPGSFGRTIEVPGPIAPHP